MIATHRISQAIPYCALTLIIAVYMGMTLNKYLPVQEGWFQYYSLLLETGKVPYKDFFYYMPPGYLYFMSWQYDMFGNNFLYYRLYGVIERIVIACLIYSLLRRYFNAYYSFVSVAIGFFAYASFNLDYPYSYYQTVFLLFVLTIHILNRITDFHAAKPSSLNYALLGAIVSFLLLMKQSVGAICLIAVSLYLLLFSLKAYSGKTALMLCLAYLSSLFAVTAGVFLWLYSDWALMPFFDQVFVHASSKGHPIDVFYKGVLRTLINTQPWAVIPLVILAYIYFPFRESSALETWNEGLAVIIATLILIIMIGVPYYIPLSQSSEWTQDFAAQITAMIVLTTVIVWFFSLVQVKHGGPFKPLLYLSFWSLVWMYGHSMSGIIEMHSTWLAAALITMSVLIGMRHQIGRISVLAFGVIVVILVADYRYKFPYMWWGWKEPNIHLSQQHLSVPGISQFEVSEKTHAVYSRIYDAIVTHTSSDDEVFVFPHMLIFNVITKRANSSFIPVTWFDVCPDHLAVAAAQWINSTKPKMIIYMELSKAVIDVHERMFRDGRPSGQRKIMSVIQDLKMRGHYHVLDRFAQDTGEYADFPIEVLLRHDT